MTSNINGIDVNECEFYEEMRELPDNLNGGYYIQHCYCGLQGDNYCICNKNPNCYFKQLVRLQKENEELKARLKTLDDEVITIEITPDEFERYKKYKRALEEIKKWATNHNPCDIDPEVKCTKEDCFECLNYDIKKITRIIDEVLNDRD